MIRGNYTWGYPEDCVPDSKYIFMNLPYNSLVIAEANCSLHEASDCTEVIAALVFKDEDIYRPSQTFKNCIVLSNRQNIN